MSSIKGTRTVKRILSFVLALGIVLTLLPASASAADTGNTICLKGMDRFSNYHASFSTEISISLDLSNMTATVEFERTNLEFGVSEKELAESEHLKSLKSDTSGKLTGKIDAAKNDSNSIHDYKSYKIPGSEYSTKLIPGVEYVIYDFQWSGNPYWIGMNDYVSGCIQISGDYKTAWIGNGNKIIYYEFVNMEPTTELPEVKKFIFGEDSFSFANSASNFFIEASNDTAGPGLTYNASNGFQLSPKYYKMLIDGLSTSEIAAINSMMSRKFFGNCFGMSAVSALLYAGDLKLSQIETGAANTYALKAPIKNPALRDAILYYQLMQKTYSVNTFLGNISGTSAENAQGLVFSLRGHLPEPVLFFVRGSDWAHAMLAYDMEVKDTGYKIMVYDPNNPKKPVTMTISSDYSKITYDSSMFNGCYLGFNLPLSTGILNDNKFQEALEPFVMPEMPENSATLKSSTDTLTIKSGGESAVFEKGKKTSGTLDVKYLGPVNEIGEEKEVIFFINPPKTRTEPWYTTIYSGPGSRISYSKSSKKGTDGVFIKVDSDEQSEIRIEPGTNTTKVNSKGGRFKVSLASDKTKGALFNTTVEGSGTEVTITPAANGAAVTTADNKPVDITVSGSNDYVTFEDIDCKDGINVNNSGSTSTIEDTDGNKVATGDATDSGGKEVVTGDALDDSDKTAGGDKTGMTPVSFDDIPGNSWYAANVRAVAEAGIINGKGNGVFAPNANVTLAEAVKLAAAVHAKLTGSSYDFSGGSPWYQPYIDYLNQTGEFPDLSGYNFNAPANRELFAKVMSGVLSAMKQSERDRNKVEDGSIPDVPNTLANKEIYDLYRAGIVTGSDAQGTYNPHSNIKRSEVAAIIHRFIDAGQRKSITLTSGQAKDISPVSTNDGDMTGYVPKGWNWKADSTQGYGLNTFTFGKYVRSDGSAVLYIDSADSPYYFKYYIYAMPDGSKSSAYTGASSGTLSSSTKASDDTEGIVFVSDGKSIKITSDWSASQYMQSGAPDGEYKLVRGLN